MAGGSAPSSLSWGCGLYCHGGWLHPGQSQCPVVLQEVGCRRSRWPPSLCVQPCQPCCCSSGPRHRPRSSVVHVLRFQRCLGCRLCKWRVGRGQRSGKRSCCGMLHVHAALLGMPQHGLQPAAWQQQQQRHAPASSASCCGTRWNWRPLSSQIQASSISKPFSSSCTWCRLRRRGREGRRSMSGAGGVYCPPHHTLHSAQAAMEVGAACH